MSEISWGDITPSIDRVIFKDESGVFLCTTTRQYLDRSKQSFYQSASANGINTGLHLSVTDIDVASLLITYYAKFAELIIEIHSGRIKAVSRALITSLEAASSLGFDLDLLGKPVFANKGKEVVL